MASSLTLATLRDRVEQMLDDSGNAIFSANLVDAGIRLALGKFNEYRPRELTVTLDAETREVSLASLTLLDHANAVVSVWFPYVSTDTAPRVLEDETDWETFTIADGTIYLRFLCDQEPTTGDDARITYQALHTINGLDSATTTTFDVRDETPLAKGAAAYTALSRAAGVSETASKMAVSTPNQAAMYKTWMREFLAGLQPRASGVVIVPNFGGK